MSKLDIILLLILGASIAYSYFKGLIRQLISLLSLMVACVVAIRYCYLGQRWFKGVVPTPDWANMIGFTIIFTAVIILGSIFGKLISKIIIRGAARTTDRLLGSLVGLIKGMLLVSLVVLVISLFFPNGKKLVQHGRISRHLLVVSKHLSRLSPELLENFQKKVQDKKKDLEEFADDAKRGMETISEKISNLPSPKESSSDE